MISDELLKNVNVDDLPQSMKDLIDVVGLKAAVILAIRYENTTLYISQKDRVVNNAIAEIIGNDKLQKLKFFYEKGTLTLPKLSSFFVNIAHSQVLFLSEAGTEVPDICKQTGYSRRQVYRILKKQDQSKEPGPYTPDFF